MVRLSRCGAHGLRVVWLEDNDLDLLPGKTRRIAVGGPSELVARIRASAINSPAEPLP